MEFKRVCRALYKYDAVEEGELSFEEDAVVYIWDDSNDEWWRASLEMAQNEAELTTGLIPYNYVEEMEHLCKARAMYDYEALNNDELSFEEGAEFLVYQKDGEDWMMVNHNGKFGFVPQSYVEEFSEDNNEDQGYIEPPKAVEQEPSPPENPDNSYHELVTATPTLTEPSSTKKSPKDDMVFWRVSEVDKKKKNKKKVRLGISMDTFYVASEDNKAAPIREWPISDLATYGVKNKHVLIEISGDNAIAFDFSCSSIKQAEAIAFKIRSCSQARFNEKAAKSSGLFGMFKKKQSKPKAPPSGKGFAVDARSPHHNTTLREKNNSPPLPALPSDKAAGYENTSFSNRYSTFEASPPKTAASPAASPAPIKAQQGTEGEIAAVLYDFSSVEEDELSVQANERIYVIDRADDAWWVCRVYYDNGQYKDGLVPSDYVSLLPAEGQAAASRSNSAPTPGPVASESRASPAKSTATTKETSGPNPDRLREWTDATGSFKVEAELIKYADGKIHLHKTNGVKIAVPLEKMSAIDVHYVSEAIGEDLSANFEAAKRERAEVARWKEFLTDAGVSVTDAATYASKFTHEKIDRQLLREMDRSTLKGLGLTEGDALRVEKACQKAKAAEDDEALAQRLQQEEVERMRRETGRGNFREYQIEQDAMLARKLQQESDATSNWTNFPSKANETRNQKYGLGLGNKTGRPAKGVDPNALFEASAKLQEQNQQERPKSMTKIATKKSAQKSGFDDDIWAVPGDKPAPKSLGIADLTAIPQLQSKSWDAFSSKPKEPVEKPVFARKDAGRTTKPSEIEEKWGFVQANFENQPTAKPDPPQAAPQPEPQAPPTFKPAGPLAQPLIPVPRGGSSNVFVPTRRPPPPKPTANVFADTPAAPPSIGAAAGVTTRAAPPQAHSFAGASVPVANNNAMGFTSQATNLFADAPKKDSEQANLHSATPAGFPEAPFGGSATGFIDNTFAKSQPSGNIFGNQTISRPASTNKLPSSHYQFDDLSLESLGLKPAPVASISKPDARPHSAMGLQSPNHPKDGFYGQQESAFKSTSSFSFADFSQRPASASQSSLASYNGPSAAPNPSLESLGSLSRNDLKPSSSNFSASPSRNDYQTGYLSDANMQFSGNKAYQPSSSGNMAFSSNYAATSRAPAGGSLVSNQPPTGFAGGAYPGSSLNQTASLSSSSLNQPGAYSAAPLNPSGGNSNQGGTFSGNSFSQTSSFSASHQNYPGSSLNQSFSSNNQASSFSTTSQNFPGSNSNQSFAASNQASSFSVTSQNYPGNSLNPSGFSATSQNYPGSSTHQSFTANNQTAGFSSGSQNYPGSSLHQTSSFSAGSHNYPGSNLPPSSLNYQTSTFSAGNLNSSGYTGSNLNQGFSGNNPGQTASFSSTSLNQMGGYSTSQSNRPDYSYAPNSGSGGYSSNVARGSAQDFKTDFGAVSMSNLGYPGSAMGVSGVPPPSHGSSYSAFSGVDPLNAGNTPAYNQPTNQQPPFSGQQPYYQQPQPSRFYQN